MIDTDRAKISILVIEGADDRRGLLRGQLAMLLPAARVETASRSLEGMLPAADIALIDGGSIARETTDLVRQLRARGFGGPLVVLTPVPDEATICAAMESLGFLSISRVVADEAPAELAKALSIAIGEDRAVADELRQARRIFAAGQAALSLQHAINNPLTALMAEAQLLQMEELSGEHRESMDRIVELCRRIVALVRELDALAAD